eukprot:1206618-Lingulodinium_polyedra.AAC.1
MHDPSFASMSEFQLFPGCSAYWLNPERYPRPFVADRVTRGRFVFARASVLPVLVAALVVSPDC